MKKIEGMLGADDISGWEVVFESENVVLEGNSGLEDRYRAMVEANEKIRG